MSNKTQILLICLILVGVLAWDIVQKNKKAHRIGIVVNQKLPDKAAWNPITNDSASISIPDTIYHHTAIGYEALRAINKNP